MPPDDVIDITQSDNSEEKSVLDLILDKPPEKKEEKEKPANRASEAEDSPEVDKESEDETVGKADGDSEEDAEGVDAEKEEEGEEDKSDEDTSEEDNLDEYLVDVTIDGKTQEVKLKDLKANYSGNKFIEANMHKTLEARKAAETQAKTLFDVNNQRKGMLQNLDKLLKLSAEPAIDWEALKKSDLNAYLLKKEEVRDSQAKQAQVQQEVARIDAEQAEIQAQAMQQYLEDQSQILVTKLPALKDAKQAVALMSSLEEGAEKHYGYTKQEFKGIVDHRAMLILHDAIEFRKLKEKSKETREKFSEDKSEKKVLIRPGAHKSSQSGAARKLDQAVIKRARESGKVDDVAATLLVRKKG